MEEVAIGRDKRIFQDRSTSFRGTVRIRLEHFNFDYPNPRNERERERVVQSLATRFREGGCYRLVPDHYIPALLDYNTFNLILQSLNLSAEGLIECSSKLPPEPILPRGTQLWCLHGRSRIEACREALPVSERWWTVNLYLGYLGIQLEVSQANTV
jgi:hypothetical protein